MYLSSTQAEPAAARLILEAWGGDRPNFLWIPTTDETLYADRINGLAGNGVGGSLVQAGGVSNPAPNNGGYINFPSSFGLSTSSPFFVMLAVDIPNPASVTGCFFKLGGPTGDGLAVGGGSTTFENSGTKLIVLRENLSWEVSSAAGFVAGLNIIALYRTTEGVIGAYNVTSGVGKDAAASNYNAPSNNLSINGYTTLRGSSSTTRALALWNTGFTNAANGTQRLRLGGYVQSLYGQSGGVELFKPVSRRIFVPIIAAGGGVSGDLSATESGADTFSATGSVLVSGSLAATETGTDSFSASGDVLVSGSLAATESGADTFAASGSVSSGPTGALIATETGADTFAASGDTSPFGSLAATETGSDTFAASGSVIVSGSLAATESGSDTFSASGSASVSGTLAATETGADTFSASGAAGSVSGTMDATETGSDTFYASDAAASAGGGYDEAKPRKKRFIVEVNGQARMFNSAKAAVQALNQQQKAQPVSQSQEAPKPVVEVDIDAVESYAEVSGRIDEYNAAYNSRRFEAILKLFADMQDEDDVEMLLLSL